ncbi:MAG: TolC family protein [Bacteroidota bacterium]
MRKLWYVLFFVVIASNLFSQYSSKQIYGLREVLQIALQNNYDLRLSNASVEYSEVDMKNAFGQYLPNISLSSSYFRQLNNPNEIRDELLNQYNARIGANLVLFDGFGREANYTRAQKTMQSAVKTVDFQKQTVYLDAYNAYINVVRAYQIVRARRENVSLGEAELSRIKARYEAGALPATAVYAQEADLGNRTLELIAAENDLNIAKAQLLTIMGMPPTMDVEFRIDDLPASLPEAEIKAFRNEIGNINNAVNIALNNRLDWKSSKLRFEATQENLEIAKSYYYPQLAANSYWSWMNTSLKGFDKSNYYFGLSLSVPIFNNFSTDLRVQSSKLELTRISVELQKLEQQILSSVQIAFLNLQSAEKQIEISSKTVLSAQENYRSTQERLNVGAATTNDLIQANTQLISSQINQINAIYNYIKAKNDLKYSIGTLSLE